MLALRLIAMPVTAAIVGLGVWIAGGWITDDFRVSMALTAGWFALAAAACFVVARRVRPLRIPLASGLRDRRRRDRGLSRPDDVARSGRGRAGRHGRARSRPRRGRAGSAPA